MKEQHDIGYLLDLILFAMVICWIGFLLSGCSSPIPLPVVKNQVAISPLQMEASQPPSPITHSLRAKTALVAPVELWTNTVTVAWNSSPSPDVVGYRLYYGSQPGKYTTTIDVGSIPTAVVRLVTDSVERWYFVCTAYNSAGLESPFSNEAHWPPYAPVLTGFTLTGTGAVKQSTDLRNWTTFTNLLGSINLPLTSGSKFFKGSNKLTIKPIWYQPQ